MNITPPDWITEEQGLLERVLPALRALQDLEREQDRELSERMREHHAAWTDAYGQKVDREVFEEALTDDAIQIRAHRAARRSREIPLSTPYFGHMVLREAKRSQEVLLGKVGVTGNGLSIVDWRNAPISRLFYEYEEEDEYEEEIAGREREGVVLLRGRAGSGKTTVALHRVAWLHYQDEKRFKPERMLVVMFNKALQTYISRVLPELGISGVSVETFHGWAARMLRRGNVSATPQSNTPSEVARLKRHPAITELIELGLKRLGARSVAWIEERLPPTLMESWAATPGEGLARIAAFRKGLGAAPERRQFSPLWAKLRARLLDHTRDLHALYDDPEGAAAVLPRALHAALPAAAARAAAASAAGHMDYEDAALLLRIGQRKAALDPDLTCPWAGAYSHIVIDEAQDLSTVEIAALVDAADQGRSVTIAGDPAQKILEDAQFEGFEQLLSRLGAGGQLTVRLDALQVGHRSTRPIMALALDALGGPDAAGEAALQSSRPGEDVDWLEGDAPQATAELAAKIAAFRERRPSALVAVLCRRKDGADRWVRDLKAAGLDGVRRADRADFSFQPGVVVSNVHQVKGLEFDGVVIVEPAEYGARDRHLLHVAITRAADQLWVFATRGRGLLGIRPRAPAQPSR